MPFFLIPFSSIATRNEVRVMKFFSWVDATAAKSFGHELAIFYIDRVQTDQKIKKDKFIQKKQRELLMKMSSKIDHFKLTTTLNFYQKAQAVNIFKWTLLDAGFDKSYVDELSDWIVRQI
jgi:hypothetical protein